MTEPRRGDVTAEESGIEDAGGAPGADVEREALRTPTSDDAVGNQPHGDRPERYDGVL
ncbi:MAG: hypothetical protein HOV94_09985 [Saccharothrix sp.]|nr:hypothetical protein [Saccharothrix sp.]